MYMLYSQITEYRAEHKGLRLQESKSSRYWRSRPDIRNWLRGRNEEDSFNFTKWYACGLYSRYDPTLRISPENRQSMLFSATQTTKVQDLARISLRPGPLYIDVDKEEETSTVSTLTQGYVVCPSDRRFLLLFTFLKKNLKKKVIVFFSSCNSVKYHAELLNYIDVPVLDLHVIVRILYFTLKLTFSF